MTPSSSAPVRPLASQRRQTVIGLVLASAILAAWIGLHIYGVYFHDWSRWSVALAPLVVAVQTWLSVGLFIIAHDAMHGSLAPARPKVGRLIGRAALLIYAGFDFTKLNVAHQAHHAAPGGPEDPDFHPDAPRSFWPWFKRFFLTYFGWGEFAVLTAAVLFALVVLGAPIPNLLVFWALPALLSAVQLFVFGTWLPHRHADKPFVDRHNARSNQMPSWLSLLTCFHFGRHHEHHLEPSVPWWRLDKG